MGCGRVKCHRHEDERGMAVDNKTHFFGECSESLLRSSR